MTVQAFTESNGHANPYDAVFDLKREWTTAEVKLAKRRVVVAESTYRLKRLAAGAKLLESIQCGDWWTSAAYDRMDRLRSDPYWRSVGGRQARQKGGDYPFFTTEQELELFRGQSRILAGANSYAIGLVEGVVSYTLGEGMTYRAVSRHKERKAPKELLAKIQDIIDYHHERNCWFGGCQPGMEEELVSRSLIDGEWFLHHQSTDEGYVDLRIVEPEQVTQPLGSPDEYSFGVLTPEGDIAGPRKAYNTRWDDSNDDVEIPASEMIHFRRNVVRNVKRGLPDFTHSTLDAFHIADRLRHNMALGAAIQATFAGIRQHDSATKAQVDSMNELVANYERTNPDTDQTERIQKFEPSMVDIPKGMNYVNPPTAQNAAAHVEILLACLRGAGRRWMAPDWVIGGDASNNNLASSLVATDPWVIRIKRNQRDNRSVGKESAWIAVRTRVEKTGAITVRVKKEGGILTEETYGWQDIRGLVDIQVEAPSPETRNKLEEAQVNQIYGMLRVKSTQTMQQDLGLDTEEEQVNFDKAAEQMGPPGEPPALPGDQAAGVMLTPQPQTPQLPELESVQESAGTCKPGERADLTGCSPATGAASKAGKSAGKPNKITTLTAKFNQAADRLEKLQGSNDIDAIKIAQQAHADAKADLQIAHAEKAAKEKAPASKSPAAKPASKKEPAKPAAKPLRSSSPAISKKIDAAKVKVAKLTAQLKAAKADLKGLKDTLKAQTVKTRPTSKPGSAVLANEVKAIYHPGATPEQIAGAIVKLQKGKRSDAVAAAEAIGMKVPPSMNKGKVIEAIQQRIEARVSAKKKIDNIKV